MSDLGTTTLHRCGSRRSKNLLVINKGKDAVEIQRDGVNWDLMEIYFLPTDIARIQKNSSESDAEYVVFETSRQMRKLAIVKAIFDRHDFWRGYERIMIADDDLIPVSCSVTDIFDLFSTTGCRVGQPALTQDSYFYHVITIQNATFAWRRTNFAEIMCPIFTREAIEEYLPSLNETISGAGLDYLWSYKEWMRYGGVAILDKTPVRHCRPVGGGETYNGLPSLHEEWMSLIKRHSIPLYPHSCFGGRGAFLGVEEVFANGIEVGGYERSVLDNPIFLNYISDERKIQALGVEMFGNYYERLALNNDAARLMHFSVAATFMLRNGKVDVQKIVDEFWDSSSWKITRPLRAVMRKLRGLPPERKPVFVDC